MVQNDIVRTPEIFAEIGKMYSTGMSAPSIAKKIGEITGKEVSVNIITGAIKRFNEKKGAVIETNKEVQNMIRGSIESAIEELAELKDILKDLAKDDDSENKDKISAIKEIRNIIETKLKIMDRLLQGFDVTKVNKLQMTQVIMNILPEFEEQGYIKILRKPGEVPDLEQLRLDEGEFVEDDKKVILTELEPSGEAPVMDNEQVPPKENKEIQEVE